MNLDQNSELQVRRGESLLFRLSGRLVPGFLTGKLTAGSSREVNRGLGCSDAFRERRRSSPVSIAKTRTDELFGDCIGSCVRHHGHLVIDLSSFRLADHFHLHISDDLALA